MMRRAISVLLIPLVMSSQCVCLGHSHPWVINSDSKEHGNQPHVHSGTAHRHHKHHSTGHSHAQQVRHTGRPNPTGTHGVPTISNAAVDHDADAIFVSPSLTSRTGRQMRGVSRGTPSVEHPGVPFPDALDSIRLMHDPGQRLRPPQLVGQCPLYLRFHSIRC